MLRSKLLVAAAALTFVPTGALAKLVPTESARIRSINIGGKRSVYYGIARGVEEIIRVEGPARIKCIVRATQDSMGTRAQYAISVFEGGTRIKRVEVEATSTKIVWNESGDRVSRSSHFFLDLPAGNHRLSFRLTSDAVRSAGLRCLNKGVRAAGTQVAVLPADLADSFTMIVKEKPIEYAVATVDSPVAIVVVGPTRLRVVSRLIYSDRMKGVHYYAVLIDRDGATLPKKLIKTKKSLLAECRDRPRWSFGRSRTFYVDIPSGLHRATFRPATSTPPGIALRFTIPREDIANDFR